MDYSKIKEIYKNGDWVFGIGEHIGCSIVFDIEKDNPQPFSYLGSNNPDDFRIATGEEVSTAKS